MACELTIWNSKTHEKQTYTCDEENSAKIVESDHSGSGTGEYVDVEGKTFSVDWSEWRLVKFVRVREEAPA